PLVPPHPPAPARRRRLCRVRRRERRRLRDRLKGLAVDGEEHPEITLGVAGLLELAAKELKLGCELAAVAVVAFSLLAEQPLEALALFLQRALRIDASFRVELRGEVRSVEACLEYGEAIMLRGLGGKGTVPFQGSLLR